MPYFCMTKTLASFWHFWMNPIQLIFELHIHLVPWLIFEKSPLREIGRTLVLAELYDAFKGD